jgi:hypothetical protein
LQFLFANAGVAALKLVVVAAAIIAAAVIAITKSLVFSIMHGIIIIVFIYITIAYQNILYSLGPVNYHTATTTTSNAIV